MTSDIDPTSIPPATEATDGSELGEEVGDDSLPGTVGFPSTDPMGVGPTDSLSDANHHDSFAERVEREQEGNTPLPHDSVRLVDDTAGGAADTESELIGEMVPPTGLVSPEEAAMHLENDA